MSPTFKYPNHSIGEHIVPFQLIFHKNKTVEEVLNIIQKKIGSWPNTEKIFVVNEENKLIGEVSFKNLLSGKPSHSISEIMNSSIEKLTDHSHQNTAIKLAIAKGLETIPVVNQEEKFLGILDAAQILKIMHEEHVEKLMHFSGILNNETLKEGYKANIYHSVKARIPWLVLGLMGGFLSTFVIRSYSPTLESEIALAFFIPVIVYMNAAVGTQAQTIYVRYSALEKIKLVKSLLFEVKVSLFIGLVLSLVMYSFAAIAFGFHIANIVALSMFLGILASAFISTTIPWLLNRLGRDPAIGSGPFTTIIHDLVSIVIYFTVAAILL